MVLSGTVEYLCSTRIRTHTQDRQGENELLGVNLTNIRIYDLARIGDEDFVGKVAIGSDEGLFVLDVTTGEYCDFEPGPIFVNRLLFEQRGQVSVLVELDCSKLVAGASWIRSGDVAFRVLFARPGFAVASSLRVREAEAP